jgi:hypothetical protein
MSLKLERRHGRYLIPVFEGWLLVLSVAMAVESVQEGSMAVFLHAPSKIRQSRCLLLYICQSIDAKPSVEPVTSLYVFPALDP